MLFIYLFFKVILWKREPQRNWFQSKELSIHLVWMIDVAMFDESYAKWQIFFVFIRKDNCNIFGNVFLFFQKWRFFFLHAFYIIYWIQVCVCVCGHRTYIWAIKADFHHFLHLIQFDFFFVLFWLTLFIISHNHHRSSLSNDIIIRGVFSEFFFLVNVVLIGKRLPLEPWNFVYTQR